MENKFSETCWRTGDPHYPFPACLAAPFPAAVALTRQNVYACRDCGELLGEPPEEVAAEEPRG